MHTSLQSMDLPSAQIQSGFQTKQRKHIVGFDIPFSGGSALWQSSHFQPEAMRTLGVRDKFLFEAFGQGPLVRPRFDTIQCGFEKFAATQPDAIAVEHLGQSITYAALNVQANRLARLLLMHGVKRGDAVALYLTRSIPMVVGILAILKIGAAYVPQHVGVAPEKVLKHILNVTQAKVVLTLDGLQDAIPLEQHQTCIAIDSALAEPFDEGDDKLQGAKPPRPDDHCFVLFTSGTTGVPNGVQVTHRNVCNILQTAPGDLSIRPGTKVAQLLSIAFDMAAWEILGCLSNGGTLLIRGKDFQEIAEQADVIIATPSILSSIDASRCKNVKTVAVAGEPCPRPLADKWSAFCTFYNSCGPTETTIVNTAEPHYPTKPTLSIGRPTPNNTVYILDENMVPCVIGEIGEMWAGGDCVTAGYLANDDLTNERYRDDPFLGNGRKMFRTRDLGRWTTEGDLEHFGRVDDQVKIRGFRVELDSVSAILESVNECSQAVTLKFNNRQLVSFVSPATCKAKDFKATMKEQLNYYCVPTCIIALDDFPRTPRGKLDKQLLLEMAVEHFEKNGMEIV